MQWRFITHKNLWNIAVALSKKAFILITVRKASPMSNHKTDGDNLICLRAILRVQYMQFRNARRCIRMRISGIPPGLAAALCSYLRNFATAAI